MSWDASYTTKVYVSVSSGAVPDASGFVSQTIFCVGSNVALFSNVYVALLNAQETYASILDGLTEREV